MVLPGRPIARIQIDSPQQVSIEMLACSLGLEWGNRVNWLSGRVEVDPSARLDTLATTTLHVGGTHWGGARKGAGGIPAGMLL